MATILFSTATQPYPTHAWNDSLTDLMGQRFTKGQDIFTLTGHMHCHNIQIIAQNLSTPSVFLEYPTVKAFEEEVKKGYDWVGITFFPTCMNLVMRQCETVRKLSPKSNIVLGGYGALAFDAAFPEYRKKELTDYVCIGEGIAFMRRLLGEPVDAPVTQRLFPKCSASPRWLDAHPKGNMGYILAELGCPSGCDFCATTQMHQNQRIQMATPENIFEWMKLYYRTYPDIQQVLVASEDYIKYKDEVMELGQLIQEDTEFGIEKLDWFTAGSIEGLCQYDWDELAMTGIGGVFIGVESKFAPQEGYQKRTGNAEEVFKALQQRGISTVGGWMCGWDFHERVNVYEDLSYFIALEPTGHQMTRVTAFPGTPMWERLKEEGRLTEIPWEDVNFYGGGFKHSSFEDHEIMDILWQGYQESYHTWGPTLMRQLKIELNGYEYCSQSRHKTLRQRAQRHRERCTQMYPLVRACEQFAPNGLVRRRVNELERRYIKYLGEPTMSQKVQSYYILQRAARAKLWEAINPMNRQPKQEPYKKYIFPGRENAPAEGTPYRTVYPIEDSAYQRDRGIFNFKFNVLGKALDALDKIDEWRGMKATVDEKGLMEKGLKFF